MSRAIALLAAASVLVLSSACGPGAAGDDASGSETGATTETTETTTTETGAPFEPDPDCIEGSSTNVSFSLDAPTWPTSVDAITELDEQRIDAHCFVSNVTETMVILECLDPDMNAHAMEIGVSGFALDSTTFPMEVRLRYIRDSWHDVTKFGEAEWIAVRNFYTEELVFAGMAGEAEFLALVPDEAPELYAPFGLALDYDVCDPDEAALEAVLDGERVLVPAPGRATLGDHEVFVSTIASESQGPEYPSLSTYSLFVG